MDIGGLDTHSNSSTLTLDPPPSAFRWSVLGIHMTMFCIATWVSSLPLELYVPSHPFTVLLGSLGCLSVFAAAAARLHLHASLRRTWAASFGDLLTTTRISDLPTLIYDCPTSLPCVLHKLSHSSTASHLHRACCDMCIASLSLLSTMCICSMSFSLTDTLRTGNTWADNIWMSIRYAFHIYNIKRCCSPKSHIKHSSPTTQTTVQYFFSSSASSWPRICRSSPPLEAQL